MQQCTIAGRVHIKPGAHHCNDPIHVLLSRHPSCLVEAKYSVALNDCVEGAAERIAAAVPRVWTRAQGGVAGQRVVRDNRRESERERLIRSPAFVVRAV